MTRRLSIADLLTQEEAAHLAVAVREYRRRRLFAVPHSFAEIETELAQAAMRPASEPSPADRPRQDPTARAGGAAIGDGEQMIISDLLTVGQTASRMQVSTRSVERRIAAGDLPAVRSGRSLRVRQEDLDAFLAAGGTRK